MHKPKLKLTLNKQKFYCVGKIEIFQQKLKNQKNNVKFSVKELF